LPLRLSCSTLSFPQDRIEIALAKTSWAGFRGVELSLRAEPLPDAEELQRRIHANELELTAVDAGIIPAGSEAEDIESLGRIGRAAALARSLDGSLVVVRAPSAGDLPGLARALTLLHKALGETVVDLCLANTADSILATPDDLHRLLGEGLPERVGAALDPAQAALAGWNPADLDRLPELPRHVYFNDARGGRVVPPEEGDLDLPALGAALRLHGYGGSVSLLLENADPWDVEPAAMRARQAAAECLGLSPI
jgi:sugar phosphate isomerase/epimerase